MMSTALMAGSWPLVRIKADLPPSPNILSLTLPTIVVIRASRMAIPLKALLLALILLLTLLSSGKAEDFKDGTNPISLMHKDGIAMNSRKLWKLEAALDYDDATANPKHDSRKGKPGNGSGGKNP